MANAWKIARKEIMKYPSVNEFPGEEDERGARDDDQRYLDDVPPHHGG